MQAPMPGISAAADEADIRGHLHSNSRSIETTIFFLCSLLGKFFLRMNTILNQRLSCHTVHVTQNLKTLILIEEL